MLARACIFFTVPSSGLAYGMLIVLDVGTRSAGALKDPPAGALAGAMLMFRGGATMSR